MDLFIAGDFSDTMSKVGAVSVQLSVSEGPCYFNRDLFGRTLIASTIRGNYCSNYFFTGDSNHELYGCDVDIGTLSSFPINYDLRDYVVFPEGKDCAFDVRVGGSDRVGNIFTESESGNIKSLAFTVDQAPPVVSINEPVVLGSGMHWSNPDKLDNPSISGTAVDLNSITSVWLTIKDEGATRWWNGSSWVASNKWFNGTDWVEADIKVTATKSGTTNVSWEYNGLTREKIRSGIFTITAYARDKFGHVGHAVISGKNRKKYALGEKEFASISMAVKEVRNWNTTYADTIYSFTSERGENMIYVSAEISPSRFAGILDSYVMWSINGANAYSGKPYAPQGGNPSFFLVTVPPVIAVPLGRPVPMGYTVFPRIEYDYEDVHREYYCPDHRTIKQDAIDKCRQEYIDMNKKTTPQRREFSDSGGSTNFSFVELNRGNCGWAVIDGRLTAGLEAIRANLNDSTIIIGIGGGYRNPIHNANINPPGAVESWHIYGRAADVLIEDFNGNGVVENAIPDGADRLLLRDAATGTGFVERLSVEYAAHIHFAW